MCAIPMDDQQADRARVPSLQAADEVTLYNAAANSAIVPGNPAVI